jgi:hypothetical protein
MAMRSPHKRPLLKPRSPKRPLSKRRLALVILAVGIPSLALIGLGVGLILQESQLEESRRTEKFDDAFIEFSTALENTAAALRDDAARQATEFGWSTREIEHDSLIVLLGHVIEGELFLPWQLTGATEDFNERIHSGQFGRALLRAERLVFSDRLSGQAV